MVVHKEKEFVCDTCGQKFNMKLNLQQHTQGKHLYGWRAQCGKKYPWPKLMHKHETTCKICLKIEKKEKQKLAEIRTNIMLQKKDQKK